RNIAMDALMELIDGLEPAFRQDSTSENVRLAQSYQRKAQFLLDFVEAENSMGFHAPQEAARVLGNAINYARMGQVALAGGRPGPVRTTLPETRTGDPVSGPQRPTN